MNGRCAAGGPAYLVGHGWARPGFRPAPRRVENAVHHSYSSLPNRAAATATDLGPPDAAAAPAGADDADLSPAEDVAAWLRSTYAPSLSRAAVLAKVRRAEAAAAAADPTRPPGLSLRRDVAPKAAMLDALAPGLAWRVFSRYPEEFAHPDAEDYWRIMAALLYTGGFSPGQVSALFKRHPCLFARTVQDPANMKAMFQWLRGDLGLSEAEVMRLVGKLPLLLQTPVEGALRPRLAFIEGLVGGRKEALAAVRRHPELLGVASAALEERAAFLEGECGLTRGEVSRMFASQPAVLLLRPAERLAPAVAFLREGLGCDGALLRRVVAQSGLLTRAPDTIMARVKALEAFGVDRPGLLAALQRFPRVLVYPLDSLKYRRKLDFLKEVLGGGPNDLVAFPQFLSYSLPRRLAPRAAAARAAGRGGLPPLSPLAMGQPAFLRAFGLSQEEYDAAVAAWAETDEGRRWLADESDDDLSE